jgi:hypothetical protein
VIASQPDRNETPHATQTDGARKTGIIFEITERKRKKKEVKYLFCSKNKATIK